MQSRPIEPPVLEPFTLAEVKAALRVTHSIQDDYIWSLARSARKLCEDTARIAISPQRWLAAFKAPDRRGDEFGLTDNIADPDRVLGRVVLTRPPLIRVISVTLVHRNGANRIPLIENVDYFVDTVFGQITWADREVIRRITDPFYNRIEVDYACGNGLLNPGSGAPLVADRTVRLVACDDAIREAIFVTAAAGYDDPDGGLNRLPERAVALLRPFWTEPRMIG